MIDSHTAGEPTRVVLGGQVPFSGSNMAERVHEMKTGLDHVRTGVILEPRGSEHLVAALLSPPVHPDSLAGLIFCNNVGYLGMCGHGAIGVIATLAHLGQISPGLHVLDTPAGSVHTELHEDGDVSVANVPSFRYLAGVCLDLESIGSVTGDVAYGGNWFFLLERPELVLRPSNVLELTGLCLEIRQELKKMGICGPEGEEIDHIELSGPAEHPSADSRNFVLCPGGVYDRSPCGTGTSAKLACLIEDGRVEEGAWFVQESTIGTRFHAKANRAKNQLIPTIKGKAWIVSESNLLFSPDDPMRFGLR